MGASARIATALAACVLALSLQGCDHTKTASQHLSSAQSSLARLVCEKKVQEAVQGARDRTMDALGRACRASASKLRDLGASERLSMEDKCLEEGAVDIEKKERTMSADAQSECVAKIMQKADDIKSSGVGAFKKLSDAMQGWWGHAAGEEKRHMNELLDGAVSRAAEDTAQFGEVLDKNQQVTDNVETLYQGRSLVHSFSNTVHHRAAIAATVLLLSTASFVAVLFVRRRRRYSVRLPIEEPMVEEGVRFVGE